MTTAEIILSVAGAVFGLGCLSTLIYGIVTHNKRNAPDDRGAIPQVKVWSRDRIPVTLLPTEEVEAFIGRNATVAMKKAVTWWNTRLGFRVFNEIGDITAEGSVCGIGVADSTAEEDHEHAVAFTRLTFDKDGAIESATVQWMPTASDETKAELIRAFAHELGHVLGLDHDYNMPESVMHPKATADAFILSDKDKTLLTLGYTDDEGVA